eukprot:tig00020964_g16808.t1
MPCTSQASFIVYALNGSTYQTENVSVAFSAAAGGDAIGALTFTIIASSFNCTPAQVAYSPATPTSTTCTLTPTNSTPSITLADLDTALAVPGVRFSAFTAVGSSMRFTVTPSRAGQIQVIAPYKSSPSPSFSLGATGAGDIVCSAKRAYPGVHLSCTLQRAVGGNALSTTEVTIQAAAGTVTGVTDIDGGAIAFTWTPAVGGGDAGVEIYATMTALKLANTSIPVVSPS